MKYPEPDITLMMRRPVAEMRIWARHNQDTLSQKLASFVKWARPLPRRVSDLTPEQRLVFRALKQGWEGGSTVTIPNAVFVQDRRAQ